MTEQADVLYVNEIAVKMGRTPAAIRGGVHKMMREGKQVDWLPPPFKLGDQWAWLRADVDIWLRQKAAGEVEA
jgi:predicted DNA-binding transcriptional regulator AlpA